MKKKSMWFELSDKEKREIIKEAVIKSNKVQQKIIDKYKKLAH